ESPFITLLVEAVSMQLRKYDYNLSVVHVDKKTVVQRLRELEDSDCAGIILDAVEMQSDDLAFFENLSIPYVIFNNSFVDKDVNTVCVYNKQGIYKSVTHLLELGHEHIGYIKSRSPVRSFDERFQEYRDLMARFRLPIHDEDVFILPYSQLGAYEELKTQLGKMQNLPTAFLCDNDILCYAALHAFKECGYVVPRDVSLIGFDDRPFCVTADPQITTLHIPRDRFGAEAVNILHEKILNGSMTPVTVQIDVELRIRGSTGPNMHYTSAV
nr:substrate-binding domain-containing protein [Treponema sp.]